MSAAGRLWRRAPAWRACLVLAVVTAGVTLLYGPWFPSQPPAPASGQYAPVTRAALLGPARTSVVLVAGRQIPLPSGEWHTIVTEIRRADPQIRSEVLVQLRGDRVVGIVVARGTTISSANASKLPFGQVCESPQAYEARVVPTGGAARECWGLVPAFFPAAWRARQSDLLYTRALDALTQAGIELPTVMVAAAWSRADLRDWAATEYFFDPSVDPALGPSVLAAPGAWTRAAAAAEPEVTQFVHQIAQWTERWTPMLERGAAGGLSDADAATASSSDRLPAPVLAATPSRQLQQSGRQAVPAADPHVLRPQP